MNIVYPSKHQPSWNGGVLGCSQYPYHKNIFCLTADGGDHFLQYGIVKNSLLFVDSSFPYQSGALSVFKSRQDSKFKLSLEKSKDTEYTGKIIMIINQPC